MYYVRQESISEKFLKRPYKTSVFLKFIQENVLSSAESNFTYWDVFFHKQRIFSI